MTRHHAKNPTEPLTEELPVDLADIGQPEMPDMTVLFVDYYLSRGGVIEHLRRGAGIDTVDTDEQGKLRHASLAELNAALFDPRDAWAIEQDDTKADMVRRMGHHYGFSPEADQEDLRKSQLIHVLICEQTGVRPGVFDLPSDGGTGGGQTTTSGPVGAD